MWRLMKPVAAILLLALVAYQPSVYAASIPSKTAENPSDSKADDLAVARAQFSTDSIEEALEAEGLTRDQIDARLEALTTEDILALAANPSQIRSAGLNMSKRAWIVVGVLVAAAVVVAADSGGNDAGGEED